MNKKILYLLHLPPPDCGVTILNKNIVGSRLKEYFFIDVVAINTSKDLEHIEKKSLRKIFIFWGIFITLLRKLLRNNYCLCYFSLTPIGIGFYKDLLFVWLLRIFRIKVLYHLHGKGISERDSIIDRFFYRLCFKNSRVIIISQSLFYDIEKYVNKKDVYILHNAIKKGLENNTFEEIIAQRLKKDSINLLFLSNMIESKGVYVALEAAKILKDNGYHFKFYFAGEWGGIKREHFFTKVQEYGLVGIVEYLGFKSGDDKCKLLKEADIFVSPTYNDIFGIVNLEAMQFGLPIISTYEGAIPEIVDDGVTGFLVLKKDSRALAEKIEVLINNPDLRIKMGKVGRKKFLNEYTFDKFENRLIDIFKKEIKCVE